MEPKYLLLFSYAFLPIELSTTWFHQMLDLPADNDAKAKELAEKELDSWRQNFCVTSQKLIKYLEYLDIKLPDQNAGGAR